MTRPRSEAEAEAAPPQDVSDDRVNVKSFNPHDYVLTFFDATDSHLSDDESKLKRL